MKEYECTEQRFLDDVKNHQINIVKDDGLHRFIRFKRPDSTSYWFDLITWPEFLCISGDCGTYVFSRIEDMFEFFKMDDNDFNKKKDRLLNINPSYWGEKLEAIGRQGYMEFDSEEFEDKVKRCFESCFESENYSEEVKKELWEEIELEVIHYSHDEHEANKAAHDFIYDLPDGEKFEFIDFFDYGSAERFTWHYIWCLYAIAWGIKKYDEAKNENTFNVDPLFNKHVALGEMLIKEQGIRKAIESFIESIDDSIKEMDAKHHCDLTYIKQKLMELL